MKKNAIIFPLVAMFLYLALSSYSSGPGRTLGLERTGASGTAGCGGSGCHGTSASSSIIATVELISSSSATVTSYSPGTPYTIRLKGVYTTSSSLMLPKFGFQLAARTSSATDAGNMIAPASCHSVIATGVTIVEHTRALLPASGTGGTGTTYTVDIPWLSPAAGTGTVTFYSALNAVDENGNVTNDHWTSVMASVTESSSTSVSPITGTTTLCVGGTSTLANATAGGVWFSATTTVATIGTSSGIVTGVSAGTAAISYISSSGTATATVTILPAPSPITGAATVCTGSTATLSSATSGGTWSVSSSAIATISAATGILSGVAVGTAAVTYTLGTGCYTTTTVAVISGTPTAIAGPALVCVGQQITLSNGVGGGTWVSSNTAQATVGAATGIVRGVAVGVPTISYTVTNACGTGTVTRTVSVRPAGTCAIGLEPVDEESVDGLTIAPNPNLGWFTVQLHADMAEPVHVVITNMLGAKVRECTTIANSKLDIQLDATPGIYFLTATTAKRRYMAKVMVQ